MRRQSPIQQISLLTRSRCGVFSAEVRLWTWNPSHLKDALNYEIVFRHLVSTENITLVIFFYLFLDVLLFKYEMGILNTAIDGLCTMLLCARGKVSFLKKCF